MLSTAADREPMQPTQPQAQAQPPVPRRLAVGALIVSSPHLVEKVRRALPAAWVKRGRNTCKYHGEEAAGVAIHLSPAAATVFDSGNGESPQLLAELLAQKQIRWYSGLRLGSKQCLGGRPDWQLDNKERENKNLMTVKDGKRRSMREDAAHFTYLELFAGIGGFRLALDRLGGECVFASEMDRDARNTYFANFGDIPSGDITEIDSSELPQHDLLTAGFPCQSFSKAGSLEGFKNEHTGLLFFEVTRVLRELQPKTFLLENVPHILAIDGGEVLAVILQELDLAGYETQYQIINSRQWLAQDRDRVYFVGFRKDLQTFSSKFEWPPSPPEPGTAKAEKDKVVSDILQTSSQITTDCTLTEHQWENVRSGIEYTKNPMNRLAKLDGKARTLTSNYKSGYMMHSEFVVQPSAKVEQQEEQQGQQGQQKQHQTEEQIQPPPPRFYTRRECARLQGFSESFDVDACKDKNRFYYQIGNAVSPVVVKHIATAFLRTGVFGAHSKPNGK